MAAGNLRFGFRDKVRTYAALHANVHECAVSSAAYLSCLLVVIWQCGILLLLRSKQSSFNAETTEPIVMKLYLNFCIALFLFGTALGGPMDANLRRTHQSVFDHVSAQHFQGLTNVQGYPTYTLNKPIVQDKMQGKQDCARSLHIYGLISVPEYIIL